MNSILFVVCAACSGGSGGGGDKAAPKAGSGSDGVTPAPTANPGEAIVPATASTNVSGAYLAGCSDDTETSYVNSLDAASSVLACVLQKSDQGLASVEVSSLEVVFADGTRATPSALPKEVPTTPWQIGVTLSPEELAKVVSVEVRYSEAGKEPTLASTQSTDFEWKGHPAFAPFTALVRSFVSITNPPLKEEISKSDRIAPFVAEGRKFHLVFVTGDRYRGDFGGIAGADAICAAAGAKLSPGRTWKALVSTGAEPVAARVPVPELVLSWPGHVVARAGEFWSGDLVQAVIHTEEGYATDHQILGSDPPDINCFAWTGSLATGVVDPTGYTCNDWTSAEGTFRGIVGKTDEDETWAKAVTLRCDKEARLYCISEASSAAVFR